MNDIKLLELEFIKLKNSWYKLYEEWLKLDDTKKQIFRLPNEPKMENGKVIA